MHKLRFRQVHLDFHTSPDIDGIGEKFDKAQWQASLKKAHIDSITCFSSCHHGESYHPTKVGRMHPGLKFDLLRAQIDACHEIDVKVPVYVSGGLNQYIAGIHPEWRAVNPEGVLYGGVTDAGWHRLCFNSPYIDYLCDYLKEVVRNYPDGDGIFIDIISKVHCCCPYCVRDMIKAGLDPKNMDDVDKFAADVLTKYYQRTTEAVRSVDPDMPIFHNSGHVKLQPQDILPYFSHLELESLPTGGWGYDHYPMSAAYCRNLPYDFLGMTGKFHGTWGEFGGFKHPNALRYECAAMLANGSKCSVGDQLHPSAQLDESTCDLIGAAYSEVEAKEPWCVDAVSMANLAILQRLDRPANATTGASRFLLESHIPFDIVDETMDFNKYKIILIAEGDALSRETADKMKAFLASGGKVILAKSAPFVADTQETWCDLPGTIGEESPFNPDFIKAAPDMVATVKTPFLMRARSQRFKASEGSIGDIYDPWFNRNIKHFCSHQHAPFRNEKSGFDAGAMNGNILYFAHDIFVLYCSVGCVEIKHFMQNAMNKFCGNDMIVTTENMPSTGRVSLMKQEKENRLILHALYANTVLRGKRGIKFSDWQNEWSYGQVEVVEELLPLYNTSYSVAVDKAPEKVTLQPEGKSVDFTCADGKVKFTLDEFTCHAMVVIE